MRVGALILAAGKGTRFGGDKINALLGGKPVWRWSYDAFSAHESVASVGIVCAADQVARLRAEAPDAAFVLAGGAERQASSRIGVEACETDIVLIHDAARPFVSTEVIDRVIAAAVRSGAAAPAVAVPDTMRIRTDSGFTLLDRSQVVAMQTPQGAKRDLLLRAHEVGTLETDEIALFERGGMGYELVTGDADNFKITTAADLQRARALLGGPERRTGIGYDVHRFSSESGRKLYLGGVYFEGERGLEGHSDADVVAHAVVDALLGAAGMGDIGVHFPNNDPRWRDEPSSTFLKHARQLIVEHGWGIVNVDISVIAEEPRVMRRASEIRACIAANLLIESERIGFKATTNERLGAIGRGEGIAAFAVATIQER